VRATRRCDHGAVIRQPVPQRIIEFVQSPPLHSRTIVRPGFGAFNKLAHVFSPLPRTQRALMRVTTPVAPKTGVVDDQETEFQNIPHYGAHG